MISLAVFYNSVSKGAKTLAFANLFLSKPIVFTAERIRWFSTC